MAQPPSARPSIWSELAPAAWLFLAAAGTFILLFAGHYASLVTRSIVMGLQAIALVVLGTWLAVAVIKPAARPRTPLLLPVLIASGAYALSAVLSQRPRLSLESTLGGLGFAIGFVFLTRLLADPWIRRRAATLFVALVAALAAGYIGQVLLNWIDWWQAVGRITLPPLRPSWAGLNFGSPNVVGTMLLLGGPLAVALVRASTSRRWPSLTIAGTVLVALFLTGSRGAYLGAALGVAAFTAVAVDRRRIGAAAALVRTTLRDRPWLFGISVLVGIGIAALIPAVLYRFGTGGEGVRIDLWRSAMAIFLEHPLTGGGPGTWVQLKIEANPAGAPNYVFNNAHNMYVQAAAELGLIGLATMTFLVVTVARRLMAGRHEADRSIRLESLAVIASLVALGGQLLVENQIRLPAVCLLIVVIVAWVDAGLGHAARESRGRLEQQWSRTRMGALLPVLTLVGVLAAAPTLVRIDIAANNSASGDHQTVHDELAKAIVFYEGAAELDPGFTLYDIERASVLARLGRVAEARAVLAAAIVDDPTAINQIGLAALDAELGNRAEALDGARRAMVIGVGEATVALNAGLIGESLGDEELARDGFTSALAWAPSLAASEFWTADQRTQPLMELIGAARLRVDRLEAALMLAYAGDTSTARRELEGLPGTSTRSVYLAAVDWLAGNPDRAIAELAAMLDRNPLDWFAAAWLSRIARLSGQADVAYRYARWALGIQGDTAPSVLFEKAIVAPGTPEARNAGIPKGYPSNMYLRGTSPLLPMPQLVLVGVR